MTIKVTTEHVTEYKDMFMSGWVATATDETGKALVSTWPEASAEYAHKVASELAAQIFPGATIEAA